MITNFIKQFSQIKMGLSKKLSRKSSRDSDDFEEFDDMESEQLLTTVSRVLAFPLLLCLMADSDYDLINH